MNNSNSIGVFDSGLGGLSIARRIREILPNENLLYVADSAHGPYGDKSAAFITQRSSAIIDFLLEQKAKTIVVACNTATVSSIQELRAKYRVPIIGVEPGIKPAVFKTNTRIIGVLATTQTLKSTSFNELSSNFSDKVKIEVQACPGLMEQVEALDLAGHKTEALVKKYVGSLLERGVDNIVLGCTHYIFLAPLIRKIAGPAIEIINTDFAVAKETARRLTVANLLSSNYALGQEQFYSSGDQPTATKQFSLLWGEPVSVSQF
ncbi:glutamate racemase [Paraglaciecola sp. L3A3]|uniref:glutamate racemase n=1 Tax=Paraglaciecola sp. L3A3 TaxID=2686358 RepID=UPI00131B91FB|nr:glutamate racemase [Paraglaciecola sp. L3A3]